MSEWNVRDLIGCSPIEATKRLEQAKISRLGMNVYHTKVDGIPEGRIEWFLWFRGKCIVWKHKMFGWIVTDMSEIGWDVNGWPNRWRPIFETNIEGISLPDSITEDDECIAFYDTCDYRVKRSSIMYYCSDYADVKETIRGQVFNQKTPMIAVVGNARLKNKIKGFIQNLANNAKIMFVEKDVKDSIETMDVNPTYNVDSLYQYSKAIESEMFEFCGIDSKDAYQKKERLVVDEQEGNDEELNYLLADGLKSRQQSIEKCIAKGLTASVEIQELVRPIAEDELIGGNVDGPDGEI